MRNIHFPGAVDMRISFDLFYNCHYMKAELLLRLRVRLTSQEPKRINLPTDRHWDRNHNGGHG